MQQTAKIIQKQLENLIQKGAATVMLTGGRPASQLYTAWKEQLNFKKLINIIFYFGDERCVSPKHPESNYGMVMQTLFTDGLPNNCKIYRMQADKKDIETAAKEYEKLLPNSIDIILLGIGVDGHIASLFPHSLQLCEEKRPCLPITCLKPPYKRLTVTPPVIKKAKTTYILAPGREKAKVVEQSKQLPLNINRFPVKMVKSPVWCPN